MVQINRIQYWLPSEFRSIQFETPYKNLIDGTWAKQWQAAQAPYLPPHRINHTTPNLQCTCGAGPFKSMKLWCKHANNR